jgi:hypothetical protein
MTSKSLDLNLSDATLVDCQLRYLSQMIIMELRQGAH